MIRPCLATPFRQVTVDANNRTQKETAKFPDADHSYGKVTMRLKLECPNQRCDHWDRAGYVAVVKPDSTKIELMRFMTPYGLPGEWSLDVTSLQPLLKGDVQFELFIDTWVKAGDGNGQGDGWLATVSFDFEGSPAPGQPVAVDVIPLWNEQNLVVGDPKKPINSQITPVSVSIPAGTARVELRSLITGHGQGNAENCAEFCSKKHSYTVKEKEYSQEIWRKDCETTVGPDKFGGQEQQGEWWHPRAGWCPGDIVYPWVENVTDVAQPGTKVQVKYGIEGMENYSKDPILEGFSDEPKSEKPLRTPPFYRTSAVLIIYK